MDARIIKDVQIYTAILWIAVFSSSLKVTAQEPAAKLPDDGWWVTYLSRRESKVGERVTTSTRKATYSLVGTVIEEGETCRWVEVTSVFSQDGKESLQLSKLLISEKELLESEEPFNRFKRGWIKNNNADVGAAKLRQERLNNDNPNVIFPGLWRNAETISNERVVDYQRGRLKIPEAKTRQATMPERVENPGRTPFHWKEVVEYTVWFDRATFPLITAARIQSNVRLNDKPNTTHVCDIELQDYGTDAKSQLPDNN